MVNPGLSPFILTLLTRDPAWVKAADAAGIDRIGIDTERLGKLRRQGHVPNARISDHELEDLRVIVAHCKHARPFARLNPIHAGTPVEIDLAITLGAKSLMLPWFHSASEAGRFIDLVAGRAEAVLLVETESAMKQLDEILRLPGVSEIMVGLNDLSLQLGFLGPMALAASDHLHTIAAKVIAVGVRFGYGGVAGAETPGLPVSPDLVLARYAQVGARTAWISRSFYSGGMQPEGFAAALAALRARIGWWFAQPQHDLARAGQALREAVHAMGNPLAELR